MIHTKRVIIVLAILFLGLPPLAGSVRAWEAPTEIHLRVETPIYTLDTSGVHVAGYAVTDLPGAPALPVWTTMVELPADGPWELSYLSQGEQILAVSGQLPAVPVPQVALDEPLGPIEIADRVTQATWADQPDPAIYRADAFYPATPVQAGPEGQQRGRRLLPIQVFPFQYNPQAGALRYHPDVQITIRVGAETGHSVGPVSQAQATVTRVVVEAEGALRIYTGQRGMYRLTYADLVGAGVPVTALDPASFAMSYLDQPVAIEIVGGDDGRFDPGDLVLFYAEPYQGRYMTSNVYRLAYGGSAGVRMAQRTVTPTGDEPLITAITQTARVEFDRSYYSTYNLPRDADHWFDDPLYTHTAAPVVTTTYALTLEHPLTDGNVLVRALLHGGADRGVNPDQSVAIAFNGQPVGLFQWQGSRLYLAEATIPATWLQPSGNQLTLTTALAQLPGLGPYWVSPDWVEVSYPTLPSARLNRLIVEGLDVVGQRALLEVTGFSSAAVRAFDVSNPRQPVRIENLLVEYTGSSFTARLWDAWPAGASPPDYALSTVGALLAPLTIEPDTPSNWRSPDHTADYIAIVHRSLWNAIQPLLDHRAAEGLRVAKVNVQDIYDEFNGGRVDPEAIRAFLAYAYQHWNGDDAPPQYVLLVGDGHYDFKGAARPDLPNLIPPYLLHIDPWIGETAADNRYVSVDSPDDYLPDMAIGRIPAKTPADLQAFVSKLLAYETTAPGDAWRDRAVFVADNKDDPAGNFHYLSDLSRLILPANIENQVIYYRLDSATDTAPKIKQAITEAFNTGAVYLQWFGHASRQRWGSGLLNMFDLLDPPRLAANTALPFTVHYSCWSGYFINIQGSRQYGNSELTLGERLLLTPGRGALADFSPSGLHIGSALVILNQGVIRTIFDARVARVGLAVDQAKLAVFANGSAVDLIDTQILFGDPATRLRLASPGIYLPLIMTTSR